MQLKCELPSCGKTFEGEEPRMCCNGRDCGCMGRPIDPVCCSVECEAAIFKASNDAQEEYFKKCEEQRYFEEQAAYEEEWQQRMRMECE